MKRFLLLFSCLLFFTIEQAAPAFKANTKYRITCQYYSNVGSVCLGSNHNSNAYFYYYLNATTPSDAWWYITAEGSGYTIRNATSGEYLTYTGDRISGVTKGLGNPTTSAGTASQWTFEEKNGSWLVRNVQSTSQVLNLRHDGTYLLGTYEGSGDSNELFTFYDESGNKVTASGSDSGNTEDSKDYTGTKGKNTLGEYWERSQVNTPVVYTTDVTNPVLYSIINLRSQQYVTVSDNVLSETNDADSRTQFYFVKGTNGVTIYSKAGEYVSTSYDESLVGNKGLSTVSGSTSAHQWNISWGTGDTYAGYAIGRVSNATNDNDYWNDYSLQNSSTQQYYREVGLYSVDDGSLFVFASSDLRHAISLQEQGLDFGITTSFSTVPEALDSLQLNGKELIYDTGTKVYYYPLPESMRQGGDFTAKLHYQLKSYFKDKYTVKINNSAPDDEGNITITDVTCNPENVFKVYVTDKETGEDAAEARLRFTFLPIVEVRVSSCNGSTYTTGSLRVSDPSIAGYDSVLIAAFKYRGASASNYPKRSYAIKLRDADGNSVDRKLLGLRSDNNWILDAMYIDPACMRNRVGTDLWNDFSESPYYIDREKKARTGTRGKFVEVFLNGTYHGLYCMTEKMDRKQLKLKKFVGASDVNNYQSEVHGVLYKSYDWTYETFMGHQSDDVTQTQEDPHSYSNYLGNETWRGYELKYPDFEEEAVDWEPLYNVVKFVATSSQSEFDANIKTMVDYPVVRDYYLFIELLLATDNHGKNMFFSFYDTQADNGKMMSVAPWDLDGTFGINYYGKTGYTSDASVLAYDSFINTYEHGQNVLFTKFRLSSGIDWKKDLAARYKELRATYFKPELLSTRFANYAKLFADSYADTREQSKWSTAHKDIQSGAQYAERWIKQRIAALDKEYAYTEPTTPTGIDNATASVKNLSAWSENGQLIVLANQTMHVSVYNAAGMLVSKSIVNDGVPTSLANLTPGFYVVNGIKVVVK